MPKNHIHYFPSCTVKIYKGMPISNSQYSHFRDMDPKEFKKILAKHLQSSKNTKK